MWRLRTGALPGLGTPGGAGGRGGLEERAGPVCDNAVSAPKLVTVTVQPAAMPCVLDAGLARGPWRVEARYDNMKSKRVPTMREEMKMMSTHEERLAGRRPFVRQAQRQYRETYTLRQGEHPHIHRVPASEERDTDHKPCDRSCGRSCHVFVPRLSTYCLTTACCHCYPIQLCSPGSPVRACSCDCSRRPMLCYGRTNVVLPDICC